MAATKRFRRCPSDRRSRRRKCQSVPRTAPTAPAFRKRESGWSKPETGWKKPETGNRAQKARAARENPTATPGSHSPRTESRAAKPSGDHRDRLDGARNTYNPIIRVWNPPPAAAHPPAKYRRLRPRDPTPAPRWRTDRDPDSRKLTRCPEKGYGPRLGWETRARCPETAGIPPHIGY